MYSKKIVIVTERYFPTIGGVEIHTFELAASLRRLGYTVCIYTFEKAPQYKAEELGLFYHQNYRSFFKIINKADLVISNGEFSIKAIVPSVLMQKKVICYYHMATSYLRDRPEIKHKIVNAIRRTIVRYPDLHIGVTAAVLDALMLPALVNKMVIYNPIRSNMINAIDTILNNTLAKNYEYDLIFCGRIIEGKGIFILAEACRFLNSRVKSIRLVIIGEGAGLIEFKNVMSELTNIQVTYVPFVQAEVLLEYYEKSKIMVLPSSSHNEGSGLVLVEFMSLNKPVIISSQKAMMETIENAGCVFENGNPLDLANKIQTLLEDENLYNQLSKNAKKSKLKFSLEIFDLKISQALNSIS